MCGHTPGAAQGRGDQDEVGHGLVGSHEGLVQLRVPRLHRRSLGQAAELVEAHGQDAGTCQSLGKGWGRDGGVIDGCESVHFQHR